MAFTTTQAGQLCLQARLQRLRVFFIQICPYLHRLRTSEKPGARFWITVPSPDTRRIHTGASQGITFGYPQPSLVGSPGIITEHTWSFQFLLCLCRRRREWSIRVPLAT